MQTILGAGGIIGKELSGHLPRFTAQVRQVSRNPKKVNPSDELMKADLLNYQEVEKAVAGSDVVYLLAGLKYDAKVWQQQWPVVMKHAIDACKKHNSKLVFFDNVYAYGQVNGIMTEETPFNPNSKKGEVRAKIATQLFDEIKAGNLKGMIIRAADFYGPGATLSLIHSTVTERLKAGKGAQWIGDKKKIHTFTYTPDAGKTVALLGNSEEAYNQTWHALTSAEKMTGEELIRIAYEIMNMPNKGVQGMSKTGVRLLGLFIPVLREFVEMMYQFENDYIFDSSKASKFLNEKATFYKEGLRETLK
ncbi:MAG TPA: NAD-dependent epimerase/dehydratase family protein [Cyclobacteriaceae bacterium]|nr:NAD-dependent epimerase/dehydratase family protein [Cyclobacteriaceae bacterium]